MKDSFSDNFENWSKFFVVLGKTSENVENRGEAERKTTFSDGFPFNNEQNTYK